MPHVHIELISAICLATGCRWGEAQGLVPSRVKGTAVHFINTKSKRRRSIPISPELESRILDHFKRFGLFTNRRNAFDECCHQGWSRVIARSESTPLRHTFASPFMANGGNILSPQKILGHSPPGDDHALCAPRSRLRAGRAGVRSQQRFSTLLRHSTGVG